MITITLDTRRGKDQLNLLALPGLAFAILAGLWFRFRRDAPPLARQHLRQTLVASLWAGGLLLGLSGVILLIGALVGDSASMWSWFAVILYFIVFHSTLVLCGMVGLSRAMAGQPFRFPLIGPDDPA